MHTKNWVIIEEQNSHILNTLQNMFFRYTSLLTIVIKNMHTRNWAIIEEQNLSHSPNFATLPSGFSAHEQFVNVSYKKYFT